ncbi:MAG: MoxR family ATPase [Actinobacteria bacterium]|nr:MoxR family ATPase [Actinomycetota bacterium]
MSSPTPTSVSEVISGLGANGYLSDEGLATAIFLSLTMGRPLLLEGEPGVGKTEVAKALSALTGGELLRLQCYEGLDASQALYEWDYPRQLLHLRAAEAAGTISSDVAVVENELYSERFLVRRPLLDAISDRHHIAPVLLIDELDRADDEFEAFLLEVLADNAVTIPELGTFRATVPPIVIITSNRTRDVHDALKRRCLYHWVEHPDLEREIAIVQSRVPGANELLSRQVSRLVAELRQIGLFKPPGVAETIDWVMALTALGRTELDASSVEASLGAVVKYREDADRVRARGIDTLVESATNAD